MDGITIGALAEELDERLRGALIDRMAMSDRNTLILHLYSQTEGRLALILGANPSRPVFELTAGSAPPALNPPPSFVMFMRKHFRRAKLAHICSPEGERVVRFLFHTIDELGDEQDLQLIFECMPRTANLIVVNERGVILNPLRHIDHSVNRAREILPAHPYSPPPEQPRPSAGTCLTKTADGLFAHVKPGSSVSQAAYGAAAGFSPILGDEAAYRAGIDPHVPFLSLDADGKQKLADAVKSICRQVAEGIRAPGVYAVECPTSREFRWVAAHAIPLTHLPYKKPYARVSDALTDYCRSASEGDAFQRLRASLSRRIGERMKKTARKRELHESELARGKTSAADKLKGELLLAYIYAVPRGASEVHLENYREQGSTVLCELDPRLSPAENAARYFRRAKRNERRFDAASRLIEQDHDELAWLASLATAVDRAESRDDLLAVEHEFNVRTDRSPGENPDQCARDGGKAPGKPASKERRRAKAYEKEGKKAQRRGRREAPPLPPREYKSSDGFTIFSGRNNFQNESLLRKAGKDDWWFHVRQQPGSHVIIASAGKEVPERTIAEAAGIAAWYSGAGRLGGSAEVDYCHVRDVKKLPGSSPGRVTYSQYKTIYAAPLDPSSLRPDASGS